MNHHPNVIYEQIEVAAIYDAVAVEIADRAVRFVVRQHYRLVLRIDHAVVIEIVVRYRHSRRREAGRRRRQRGRVQAP